MRISHREMESSLSAQMLEFPYLGDESQHLGWPPDFLRCLAKRYPEIPFWLPPFHSCLAFFILWGFQKNSTKKSKRNAMAQSKEPYKNSQEMDLTQSFCHLYFQVEQAYLSSLWNPLFFPTSLSCPFCPLCSQYISTFVSWCLPSPDPCMVKGGLGRNVKEQGPRQFRSYVGEAGRNHVTRRPR